MIVINFKYLLIALEIKIIILCEFMAFTIQNYIKDHKLLIQDIIIMHKHSVGFSIFKLMEENHDLKKTFIQIHLPIQNVTSKGFNLCFKKINNKMYDTYHDK